MVGSTHQHTHTGQEFHLLYIQYVSTFYITLSVILIVHEYQHLTSLQFLVVGQ